MRNKRGVRVIVIIGVILLSLTVFFFKIEEISDAIIRFKVACFDLLPKEPEQSQIDFSQYTPLADEPKSWYTDNMLVAHACGGIDGRDYTNSREALELALYDEFMSTPIKYLYTPMDVGILLEYMKQNPDFYVVTDTKGNTEYLCRIINDIVDMARESGYEDLLDRFIIQIYFEQDYELIESIYPFSNVIYTLYTSGTRDFTRVVEFCVTNNIHVVTMPFGNICDKDFLSTFKEMNVKVYVHTVNDLDQIKNLKELGVDGFYTDYVRLGDLDKARIN